MDMPTSENVGFEFDKEKELFPVAESLKGPISSFSSEHKNQIREEAINTGELVNSFITDQNEEVWPFQDCAPFSDYDQKKLRQDLIRVKNIGAIVDKSLSGEFDTLSPPDQADHLYLEQLINEAVLVEASRRAYLAATGQGKDDIEFCKTMIKQSCELLYPAPSRELALDCLGLFETRIQSLPVNNPIVKSFVENIMQRYSFLAEAAGRTPIKLNETVQAELLGLLQATYRPIFDHIQSEFPQINNANLPEVTRAFLEWTGYAAEGWKLKYVGKNRVGYMVDPAAKTLELGERTKEITWAAFERLMIHEVGVHVARANNGGRFGIKGLEQGMIGSESAEEGLAILLEKVWAGTASKEVIDRDQYRYILGSYAAGALDNQLHGPQETFDFAVTLKMISQLSRQDDPDVDMEKMQLAARKDMFEHVFRIFRGMPQGCVMLKDLVYFGGYSQMVELFNKTESGKSVKDLVAELLRGKYSPFDPRHQHIIESLYA